MKFLPDNLNMIKVFSFIVDNRKNKPLKSHSFFEDMDSNAMEPIFNENFTFKSMQPNKHAYLLVIYGTFEDILNTEDDDEEVDFDSLIFGFSLVPLFR